MKDFIIWLAIVGFGIVIYSVIASDKQNSDEANNAGCLGICIIGFVILIGIIASSM